MTVDLEAARRVRISLDGHDLELTLDLPRAYQILPMVHDPAIRDAAIDEDDLVGELVQIAEVGGERLDRDLARRLVREADPLTTVLAARNLLYEVACEQGRAYTACPACGAEAALDLASFGLLLHAPAWQLFERGVVLAPLALSKPLARGARGAVPSATAIRFELPSLRLGIAGAGGAARGRLEAIDRDRERAAWARWAPAAAARAEGRRWWRPAHPGFTAVLRLSVAVEELVAVDGRALDATPEQLERLYAADVHYLDTLYRYAYATDAPGDATVACASCHAQYLPVR